MGASDQDLKTQLSDIQKRLSEATFNSPKRSPSQRQDEYAKFKPHQPSNLSNSTSNPKEKKSLSSFLTKREKRVSLPVLESSKTPSVKNSGKDMDFVVGLSENLLVECRRLQAENQQKASQLKTFEDELNKLKANNSTLTSKLNETLQNEEKYKDLNWELELKFQQLTQEHQTTSMNYSKSQKELSKQLDLSNDIRNELEEAHLHKHNLQEEFSSNKASVSQEIQSLKNHVDELNDVNTRLNDELDDLRQKLDDANKKPAESQLKSIPNLQPADDSDSDEEFNEPGVSPVKIIPSNITALETEQLQSSLSSAHQTIAKLRQQILKLRSNELKGKSAEFKSIPLSGNVKRSSKIIDSGRNLLGNSNRSSTYVVDSEADEWENFEGDSTLSNIEATPSKSKKQRPLSTLSTTSNELIDDSESDIEDNEHYQPAPLSAELSPISIEDVQRYADAHNLVLLPMTEYETLKTPESPSKDSPFKNFKEADIVSKAKERGFSIFSQQEWSTQKKELETKCLEVKALNDRLLLISETEKKYAKEAADYRVKLDTALAEVSAEHLKFEELEEKLQNPSEEYIKDVALKQNLHLIGLDEYEDLQTEISSLEYKLANPSADFITNKANSLGLKVLKVDGHSTLLSEIEALKNSYNESELSKKDLESKVYSLNEQVEQHISSNQDLQSKYTSISETHEKVLQDHTAVIDSLNAESTKKLHELSELSASKLAALSGEIAALKEAEATHSSALENEVKSKEELQKSIKSPSVDYIKEKASVLGLRVVEVSIYEKELNDFQSAIKTLESNLESKTNDLLEKDKETTNLIDGLKKQIDDPSVEYIQQKAISSGYVALNKSDHDNTLAELNNNIQVLEAELESQKQKEISSNEIISKLQSENEIISKLQSEIESPSIDYLNQKALSSEYKLVPIIEFNSLLARSEKTLEELANEKDSVVLTKERLNELNNPTREFVTDKAEKHGLVTVSFDDHQKLLLDSQSPSIEHITEKAKLLGHEVISNAEYSDFVKTTSSPGKEFITSNAAGLGLVAISQAEFDQNKQELFDLKKELAERDLLPSASPDDVVIKQADYDQLFAKANLTIDDLAKDQNKVVLDRESYDSLLNPTPESITTHADKHNLTVIPKEDYQGLVRENEHPSIDQLKSKASLHDQVVVSRSHYDTLKSNIDEPSVDYIKEKAAAAGLSVLYNNEFDEMRAKAGKSVEELSNEQHKVLLSEKEYENLKNPDSDTITKLAATAGLTVLATHEFNSMKKSIDSPNAKYLEEKAKLSSQVIIPQEEYDNLKAVEESPSVDFLSSKAKTLSYDLVPSNELNELQSKAAKSITEIAAESNQVVLPKDEFNSLKAVQESPSADFLSSKAQLLSLSLIPAAELNQLQAQANKSISDLAKESNQVVLTQDEYKSLKSPSKAALLAEVGALGLVTLGVSEHEKLVKPSTSELEKFASSQNLVLVPKDSFTQLTHRSSKSVHELAKESNLKVLTIDEFSQLASPSQERLKDLVTAAGLVSVTKEAHAKLTSPDIVKLAESNGLVAVPKDDYSSLKAKAETPDESLIKSKGYILKDEISYNEVEELAGRFHSKLVDIHPVTQRSLSSSNTNRQAAPDSQSLSTFASTINESEFTDALSRVDSNTSTIDGSSVSVHDAQELGIDELRAGASTLGYSLVPIGGANRDSVTEGDYSGFDTIGRDESIDEKEQVLKRAADLGLIVLEEHEYSELENKDISEKDLKVKANQLGLQVLNSSEVERLKNPTEEEIRYASEKLGLVVLTDNEFNKVTKNEIQDIQPENGVTTETIKSIGNENGIKILTDEEYEEYEKLKNNKSDSSKWDLAKLTLGASALGLAVVDKKSINVPTITKDDILSKANEFGLVAVNQNEYESLKAIPKQLSKEDFVSKASQFGLIAIDKNDYNESTAQIANDQSIHTKSIVSEDTQDESNDETDEEVIPVPLTKEQVEENARNFGLLAIPENSFIATNVSRTPDVNNVVVLPITYYNKLTKSEAFNLDKVSNEELQEQISKRGLQITTFDTENKDSGSHLTRRSTLTSLTSSNSRKNIADEASNAAAYEFDHPTARTSRSHSRIPSLSQSRAGSFKPISRDISVDGGLSLMTNASLTEARIIPALTQTVIGEYLHKYYRRLGPLSSISETRHERYFWIHPYTLTLYWSTTNPVLGNPASHKTRAAAIVGVESVEDNNPLPAGLHHKSIIVHSQTRSIKFTCPTRQRHNIWYNSLRYLIQRSMDGIELDEDFDHLLDSRI